ncbi:MAG TPA: DEDD exonuclease domain-containing protein [Actinomycetota bacterium]|nr:DEDD exonuclease domain-containing protein [Actinomycetota bacterium]
MAPSRAAALAAAVEEPIQTTLEEGVPLDEVTFVAVDLETTGGSPKDSRITEVGAVKIRGGERLGSFSTLVNPQIAIPRSITHLTGIDDVMVAGAPTIEWVLPAFAEFARGCVFVAHNASFDFTFLNVALRRLDYAVLDGPPVCTSRLARRVVWPDVPNTRLHTLAQYFRTSARPNHRALPDAEACAEVLHGLLELGGRLGIRTLGELRAAVRAKGRPNFGKIRLADDLPRAPGVYLFRGREGHVLYVGKSKDLRTRVKSYFYGDSRKKVEDLLEQTHRVEGIACGNELESLVLEARLIREHEPRFNRRGKTWRRYAYLKLDASEAYPRFKVVREPKGDAAYVGPFPSSQAAHLAKEAIEDVVPIRRCSTSMRVSTRFAACALADMGRCAAPCDGRVSPERYGELVRTIFSSLSRPDGLLAALEERMHAFAAQERFEEAASARDRLRALAEALVRSRVDGWLLTTSLELRDPDGRHVRLERGTLVREDDRREPLGIPCPRERADELGALRAWIVRNPMRLLDADAPVAEPVDGGARLHGLVSRFRAMQSDGTRRER